MLILLSACAVQQLSEPAARIETVPIVKQETTIALLGATGLVGGHILRQALDQGYRIKALARTPAKLAEFKDRIEIVKGDARDRATIDALLQGSDVVLSALGPVRADGADAKTVSTTATGHIVALMPKHNIQRYILVSGAAVKIPGDQRNFIGWLVRQLALLRYPSTVKDKQAEYQVLAASAVNWVLVRCPIIKRQESRGKARASLKTVSSFSVRVGEVVDFMLQQIESNQFLGKAPFLESE